MIQIGIDTGKNTGIGIWDTDKQEFIDIVCVKIHQAFDIVKQYPQAKIFVEDARKRRWFGKRSSEKLQGVGSVKRDAVIWEDFLKDLGFSYKMIHPLVGGTKLTAKKFKEISGWEKTTNEHSRDAAMMVFKNKDNAYISISSKS